MLGCASPACPSFPTPQGKSWTAIGSICKSNILNLQICNLQIFSICKSAIYKYSKSANVCKSNILLANVKAPPLLVLSILFLRPTLFLPPSIHIVRNHSFCYFYPCNCFSILAWTGFESQNISGSQIPRFCRKSSGQIIGRENIRKNLRKSSSQIIGKEKCSNSKHQSCRSWALLIAFSVDVTKPSAFCSITIVGISIYSHHKYFYCNSWQISI